MEVKALNENFEICSQTSLKYFDLVWERKYYENGRFSIQIKASDYDPDMRYIYTKERPELGMIQKVEYTQDDSMVILSGFFYEHALNDKIAYPVFTQYGTRSLFAVTAVTNYMDDLPLTIASGDYSQEGEKATRQATGSNLDDLCHEVLQAEEKAYRCVYDYENDRMVFEIYQGADRTQAQTENNFVVFSEGFRNIRDARVTEDSSNYKNYFVIGGQGEGSDRVYAVLDLSGTESKKMQFLDMRDIEYDQDSMTAAQYREILIEKGREKAADYVDIHNVEFDADPDTGFIYLEDYDLGDRCDIVIEDIQRSYEARIIEVMETWSKGEHRVTLTFGDKIPTRFEKVRLR